MGVFGGVEKVRALGANGVAEGSTLGVVWFEVGGDMMSAKVVVEEALEQALCLFEFWGFSSFNGRKLVHVVNGIESVVTHGIIFHSLVWRRDHDMVHKLKVIGQRVWLFGSNILKKPSEKHGIRESHFATLSHTYHSMSDIVSKIEVFANGETIEHVAQGCIGHHESRLDLREEEDKGWGEDHLKNDEIGHSKNEDGANLFINVEKTIKTNCRKDVAKIWFVIEEVRKDDPSFVKELIYEILVNLSFFAGKSSSTMIHGDVVGGVMMINVGRFWHDAPKIRENKKRHDYFYMPKVFRK
ncbi:hypothetical protein Tco_1176653 [Tanacetum coccineum]